MGRSMGQSVEQAYDALIAAGEIRDDPAQRAVLPLLDALRARAGAPPPKRGLRALLSRPPESDGPRGLYLWGGVGSGKSMLMDLFVSTLAARPGAAVRRVHFHPFMQEVQAALDAARRGGAEDALAPVAAGLADGLRVLALDEMEITDIADAMIVGRLFEMLLDAGVMIVTTSNRAPDALYENGLNRDLFLPFIALLKARLIVHHMGSERDHRQGRLAGAKRYFCPADSAARAAMDAIWQGLTGGREGPHHLALKGRVLELRRFHNGAARAGFHELCGQPLGPADFLALAGAVRVLLLEDVPQMGRSNYNEARRFVMLIDALYEAKVRLIMSAAAAPEALYLEGSGSFEFARTASRLREMQSAGWGGDGGADGSEDGRSDGGAGRGGAG